MCRGPGAAVFSCGNTSPLRSRICSASVRTIRIDLVSVFSLEFCVRVLLAIYKQAVLSRLVSAGVNEFCRLRVRSLVCLLACMQRALLLVSRGSAFGACLLSPASFAFGIVVKNEPRANICMLQKLCKCFERARLPGYRQSSACHRHVPLSTGMQWY